MIYKVRDRGHSEPIITGHLKGAIDNNRISFFSVWIKIYTKVNIRFHKIF